MSILDTMATGRVVTIAIAAIAVGFALAWWSQRRRADRLEQDVEWERRKVAAAIDMRDRARQELREARITLGIVTESLLDTYMTAEEFNRRLFGQRNR